MCDNLQGPTPTPKPCVVRQSSNGYVCRKCRVRCILDVKNKFANRHGLVYWVCSLIVVVWFDFESPRYCFSGWKLFQMNFKSVKLFWLFPAWRTLMSGFFQFFLSNSADWCVKCIEEVCWSWNFPWSSNWSWAVCSFESTQSTCQFLFAYWRDLGDQK